MAPAVIETTDRFLRDGIIERRLDGSFGTTEKGATWLAMILRVPYPTRLEMWVDERGEKI
jgi:hypothetical protein